MNPIYGVWLCVLLLPCVASYKMCLFVPGISNSQILFNARVAETLAKAGHDITMILLNSMEDFEMNVKVAKEVKIHEVNASFGMSKSVIDERHSKIIYRDIGVWDPAFRENIKMATDFLTKACRKTVENEEFITWLTNEKFDLAFTHMYDVCPIGLIYHAKIPSWIWLNSGALMDFIAYHMGVPLIPSFVPPITQGSSDHMDFKERAKSLLGHMLTPIVWRKLFADRETAIFREAIDPEFPDIVDLAKKCPLVMVNSNELYDLPRPTLAKIINIGGLGVERKDAKKLPKEFRRIVDKAEGVVVFSFGSVAAGHQMPDEWKHAFLDAFSRFPKHHFIWRYEATDLEDRLPANVHQFKWSPQADLLQNPKTKAFVSHGGYNSLQEAISAGVPMITIPLFGDQPKNAMFAERQQFSINLRKSEINADKITEALQKILEDESYSSKIRRISHMVEKKPLSPSTLLVSWAEFAAEFKTLDNLVPAGNSLNFFQYHSLDVIALFGSIAVLLLYTLFKILKLSFAMLPLSFRNRKEKQT